MLLSVLSLFMFNACYDTSYENGPMNNLANYESIVFDQYQNLPNGSFPYINSYFSPKNPAHMYLPTWLNNNFFSMDVNSTASVVYDFMNFDRADSLNYMSQTYKLISSMEYKNVWGTPFVESFTPSKPAETIIPSILSAQTFPTEYVVVKYNISVEEPLIELNKEVLYLNQNFNFLTGATWAEFTPPVGYFNKDISGKGRVWSTYVINATANNRAIMANCNDKTGGDMWFVTSRIDLTAAVTPRFTLDLGTGYHKGHDCLKVLITENFNGSDPETSQWQDISNELGVRNIPAVAGYPSLHNLKIIDLSAYVGKSVYIALNYYLPTKSTNYTDATLYVVDNMKMYETRDVASINNVQEKYDVYKRVDENWGKLESVYVLQPDDYGSVGLQDIPIVKSEEYISQILKDKIITTDNIVVVYKTTSTSTYAESFIKTDDIWKKAPLPPIEKQTDKFIYINSKEKWVHVESVDP